MLWQKDKLALRFFREHGLHAILICRFDAAYEGA